MYKGGGGGGDLIKGIEELSYAQAIFCFPALGRSAARKILIFLPKPQSDRRFASGKLRAPRKARRAQRRGPFAGCSPQILGAGGLGPANRHQAPSCPEANCIPQGHGLGSEDAVRRGRCASSSGWRSACLRRAAASPPAWRAASRGTQQRRNHSGVLWVKERFMKGSSFFFFFLIRRGNRTP